MTEWEHFPNPPIREALLDIRAALPETAKIDDLAVFEECVADSYPTKRVKTQGSATMRIGESGQMEIHRQNAEPLGYLFTSRDGCQIVQARLDGFTLSRLPVYQSWDDLRAEAYRLWTEYTKIATPSTVSRVALRYINVIEIPMPFGDFREYVLTTPEIAPDLPQVLGSFFVRLEIPDPAGRGLAIIIETQGKPETAERFPFVFDIDAIKEQEFDPYGESLWTALDELHNFKNEIFHRSMTKKAKDLFR